MKRNTGRVSIVFYSFGVNQPTATSLYNQDASLLLQKSILSPRSVFYFTDSKDVLSKLFNVVCVIAVALLGCISQRALVSVLSTGMFFFFLGVIVD